MINDLRWTLRMMQTTVRDENDGHLLTFWEKLSVAWQVILGIIVIDHEYE